MLKLTPMNERIDQGMGLIFGKHQKESAMTISHTKRKLSECSLDSLYMIHSILMFEEISRQHKKMHTLRRDEYPTGSIVTSVVKYDKKYELSSDNGTKNAVILPREEFLEIHFMPFGYVEKVQDKKIILESLFLAIKDAPKMIKTIREISNTNPKINIIFSATNYSAAILAKRIGLYVSEKKDYRDFKDRLKNEKKDGYDIFTDNIPLLVNNAEKMLIDIEQTMKSSFDHYDLTEKQARIDAILALFM
jgi:hypothetical protein